MGRVRVKKRGGTRTVHSLRGKSSGIMSGNYPWIIVENYQWELSSENYYLVYHHAENLRFIGILAYPKIEFESFYAFTLFMSNISLR